MVINKKYLRDKKIHATNETCLDLDWTKQWLKINLWDF